MCRCSMKLIVEPDAGVAPILSAIKRARRTIDVLIFRLDRPEVSDAIAGAVRRGVAVRALIAHTNSGGEKSLRKLEMRLLEGGVAVSRTADDLVRYHGKLMIVDHRVLHVYGFNYTRLDMKRSRRFGIVTRNRRLVDEAVVSPDNARDRLTAFIARARRQLLIYDPKLSDPAILRLLAERVRSGIDVRVIGSLGGSKAPLTAERYPGKRLPRVQGNRPRRQPGVSGKPEPSEGRARTAPGDWPDCRRRKGGARNPAGLRAGLGVDAGWPEVRRTRRSRRTRRTAASRRTRCMDASPRRR